MTKDNLPTVNIKGKEYVMVKDRVLAFNEIFPNGCIQTDIVSPLDSKTVIVKAVVTPDVKNPDRKFIDFSQAVIGEGMINKTSALENASTSAVGRALAYMGIGVIESVASADEVKKATSGIIEENDPDFAPHPAVATPPQDDTPKSFYGATEAQISLIKKLTKQKGEVGESLTKTYGNIDLLSKLDASKLINELLKLPAIQ